MAPNTPFSGRKLLLFLVLWNASYGTSYAQQRPPNYIITSDTGSAIAVPPAMWQVLSDPGGGLSFTEVLRATGFQDTDRTVHYETNTYWIRFRLTNGMSREAEIGLPVEAAYADIYSRTGNSAWTHEQTGNLVQWSKRAGLKRIPAFTVTILPEQTLEVYERLRWNFIAAQPDTLEVQVAGTEKLILQNYVTDDQSFMTSIQDAFLLGLFVLTLLISFYYFLVVREKEFLFFSFFALSSIINALSSLNDVFLREHPAFLLFLYLLSTLFSEFLLIHFLRYFLKTASRFPRWDKMLIVFSFLVMLATLFARFSSSVLQANLGSVSHFCYNLTLLIAGLVVLTTLSMYIRKADKPVRLMIVALSPVLLLQVTVYLLYVIYHMFSPRLGAPALHGRQLSFDKVAFLIMIACYLWMMAFFNWVLFLRFSDIRKALVQQSTLDQLKSRFFANISHEFRTPLTLIMGPLEDFQVSKNNQDLISFVPEMHRNSKRLLELINQLLDLSRLDNTQYRIDTARTDIIPFVKQIVHSFSSLAHRKNIDLETEMDSRLKERLISESIHFYFDEDIMEKILANLLSNAFKFTPSGGSILVSMQLPEKEKNMLLLKVEDSGIGIPADKLPFIFDRFYQSDDSAIRSFGGSGIGLSLVKELISLHQGSISATSEAGKGTIISCLFPLNQKIYTAGKGPDGPHTSKLPFAGVVEDQETEEDAEKRTGKPMILLVEDQRDVRKYIREKLTGDFQVTEARNGREGVEKALNDIPDLIVSDVMMPEIDGFELCRKLKTDNRTCHIPIILLTARAEDLDKMAGLETGADAYMIKPFNSRELVIRINGLITTRDRIKSKFSDKLVIRPEEITVTSRDQVFIKNLLAIIERHIPDEHFTVEILAKEVHMSVSQINRKLKGIINQTPQHLIRSLRMQRAIDLLKKNAGTISEISYQVGYEDPGYFSKVFKNHFGCLPSEKDKFPETMQPDSNINPATK